jgi:hypothetical protein
MRAERWWSCRNVLNRGSPRGMSTIYDDDASMVPQSRQV